MIENTYGHPIYSLTCDICGYEAGEVFDYLSDAVDYEKNNGWKSLKRNGEWEDVCPDCQQAKGGQVDESD